MRQVIQNELGGPDVLTTVNSDIPTPLPGEVLIQVKAAGLNPVDSKTRESGGILDSTPPFSLGWDVSGTIAAVGFGVTIHKIGDEVYGFPRFPHFAAAYSDYITAPARHFTAKPSRLSHVEAAALPLTGLTAWQALNDRTPVLPQQRVLIHAAGGGVGHLAVQIAKAKGAYVIATASQAKHDTVLALGADEVIDYRTHNFEDQTGDIDIAFDPVGDDYATRSAHLVVDGGAVTSILPDAEPISDHDAQRVDYAVLLAEPDRMGLMALADLVEQDKLKPIISAVYPLEDVVEAHRALDNGSILGKIVLEL
ncbi:NADP-dependent oxidoreductase [Haloglycomyces albus]|uniref:NADP-dependent oxidoreductase n=1 Tax=Haloglycomyces albus TaxID=526067 RepID=UPI00046CB78B|nr:NADP-dependent oxidoreductase [Haloglycomyces albus]